MERVQAGVAALQDHLASQDLSGAIRLASREGVLLEHAGGLADRATGTPNTIDTRFGIASVTKMFTATAVCRLVDHGAIGFSDRVVDLLPPEKRPTTLLDDVTVHHLLSHTSGIADYFDEENVGAAAYDQVWLEHSSYMFTEPIHFLPLFSELAPLHPPGVETHYSNAAFVLLAIVIAELTGTRFVDHIEDTLFRVAGMTDSGFFRLDEVHERTAIGYIPLEDGGWRTNHYSIPVIGGGDGGAYSTVEDLARFLDALEGGRFFGPEVWAQMGTVHSDLGWAQYGYGLLISDAGGIHCFGHGGADPGFSARAYRYPDLDLTVTMLGNRIEETDGAMTVLRDALEARG
jgi:CubicO group peptidase (beta-lactamase class C family)